MTKHHHDCDCGICATPVFERNHYYYGKLMTARDFCQEQDYLNGKRQLLNRSLFGWGVVCGLDVQQPGESGPICVSEGLALDCCGREILLCDEHRVPLEDVVRAVKDPQRGHTYPLAVCLEYEEKKTEPTSQADCDGTEKTDFNRIRDSYRIRVRPWNDVEHCTKHDPSCECYLDAIEGAPPGVADDQDQEREADRVQSDRPIDYDGEDGERLRDKGSEASHQNHRKWVPCDCDVPGLREHLCECSKHCDVGCEHCDCIVLARVDVTFREVSDDDSKRQGPQCGEPEGTVVVLDIDTCSHRRLVHGNGALYHLIECFHGDAPRVVDFGWRGLTRRRHNRRITWNEFRAIMGNVPKEDRKKPCQERHNVGLLQVAFSQPIKPETLNKHSFIVTVSIVDPATGYIRVVRVPNTGICYEERDGCHIATFMTSRRWIRDETSGNSAILTQLQSRRRGFDVEVTLRGSLIVGENGRSLDGEHIDDRLPTGNGVQGGDFVDWFRVDSRADKSRKKKRDGVQVGSSL